SRLSARRPELVRRALWRRRERRSPLQPMAVAPTLLRDPGRARRLRLAPHLRSPPNWGVVVRVAVSLGHSKGSHLLRRIPSAKLCRRWRRNTTDGISERQPNSERPGSNDSVEAVFAAVRLPISAALRAGYCHAARTNVAISTRRPRPAPNRPFGPWTRCRHWC